MLTDRQKQMLFCIEALYNTGNPHAVSLRKLFLEEFDLEWMGERELPVTKKSKITQEQADEAVRTYLEDKNG